MPKTKRLVTSIGQTLNPLYRHVKSATFKLSPYDKQGNKLARFLFVNFAGGDKRLKMDNFKLNVVVDPTIKNSYMEAQFSRLTRK